MKLRIFKEGPYWVAEYQGVRLATAAHFWRAVESCRWLLKRRELVTKISKNLEMLKGAQA